MWVIQKSNFEISRFVHRLLEYWLPRQVRVLGAPCDLFISAMMTSHRLGGGGERWGGGRDTSRTELKTQERIYSFV